jgi:signal transduction histidine kinase
MAELIDALLSLSRVSRKDISRLDVDAGEMARAAAAQLQTNDPSRSVELVIAEGLRVCADPHLLRIVFDNLLGNAWKFTAKCAGPKIEVGSIDQEGVPALFIRDNGAGFNMEYAGKLFAPFQRLHQASDFAGTGIGLATVERIVRRHGGKVWAYGEPGAGATFLFTLAAPGVEPNTGTGRDSDAAREAAAQLRLSRAPAGGVEL